jgi:hypothetical protein
VLGSALVNDEEQEHDIKDYKHFNLQKAKNQTVTNMKAIHSNDS